jgi:WD40 repeat protein
VRLNHYLYLQFPLRLLPILGPSGSGKSSLACAGLIPELARRPLPGKSQVRVAVLVPGTHPVEALAIVLARIATNDQTPVEKTKQFKKALKEATNNIYDGLRLIANHLSDIALSPLVVLIDQFEEVYSLCKDKQERQIFIDNLIHATGDSTGYVSVIITLRSDFLGEAQRHTALNQVIAAKGVIVPAMSEDELRQAITKPAENAGYPLDEAVVTLLLKDTDGREGALPLLQFALTRIWEGLKKGVEPVTTLRDIGGVGGGLAQEAQRIFNSLNDEEQKIARRVFVGLVQLGEGATSDTRLRANFNSLDKPESVKRVIEKFAHPGVRLLTVSSEEGIETVEITHEALFANWGKMKEWLDSGRSDTRFRRRLQDAATVWKDNNRPEGSLWRPPDLDLLREYSERAHDNMTPPQVEFFNASKRAENNRKCRFRLGFIGLVTITLFAVYQWRNAELRRIEQAAIIAKSSLSNNPLQGMVSAISAVGQSRSPFLNFLNQSFSQSILDSLFSAVEISREKNLLKGHEGEAYSVAISTDGQTIISGGEDGTVRMWNLKGQLLVKPFKGHKGYVYSVAISTDGKTIISGGEDGTVRLWNRNGQLLAKPFKGHEGYVYSVAISTDGQTIISGGEDGTVRVWNRNGQSLAEPFKGHQGRVYSIAISKDGQIILSGSQDGSVRIWNRKGQPLAKPFKGHQGIVYSVVISTDGQTIISGGKDGTVRMWNSKGQPLGTPFKGHQGDVITVAISTDGKTILSGGEDGTVRMWSSKGQPLGTPFKGHQGRIYSVTISTDEKTILSGGFDGTVRIWSPKGQPLGLPFKGHQGRIYSVAISADKQTIFSGGFDGTIRMWNRNGQPLGSPFKGHRGEIRSIAIINGQIIFTEGEDGTIRMWNPKGQLLNSTFEGHKGRVYSLVVSTDEQTVISGGKDGTVRVWNSKGQLQGSPFKGHQGYVSSVAISTDGQTIISGGGKDGTVRMWNREGQLLVTPFTAHKDGVFSVAISTDGKTILSGGFDDTDTVRAWNSKGTALSSSFKGHEGYVSSVAISTAHGQVILSGGEDGTVRMWNFKGQPLGTPFKVHEGDVTSLAISTDKTALLEYGILNLILG